MLDRDDQVSHVTTAVTVQHADRQDRRGRRHLADDAGHVGAVTVGRGAAETAFLLRHRVRTDQVEPLLRRHQAAAQLRVAQVDTRVDHRDSYAGTEVRGERRVVRQLQLQTRPQLSVLRLPAELALVPDGGAALVSQPLAFVPDDGPPFVIDPRQSVAGAGRYLHAAGTGQQAAPVLLDADRR